jgi:hypothetical protein
VPTSVNGEELCVNGMSFSKRQSPFANSAIVVSIEHEDVLRYVRTEALRLGITTEKTHLSSRAANNSKTTPLEIPTSNNNSDNNGSNNSGDDLRYNSGVKENRLYTIEEIDRATEVFFAELYRKTPEDSPLWGLHWQRIMERRAALLGGGQLVVPVQ